MEEMESNNLGDRFLHLLKLNNALNKQNGQSDKQNLSMDLLLEYLMFWFLATIVFAVYIIGPHYHN